MPEPTTTATAAAATYVAAGLSVPVISLLGAPLGLRADELIAGLAGSLVTIVLLNSVPSTGDTWQHLLRTFAKRIFVSVASAITAGYLTPLGLLVASLPDPLVLGVAFAIGGFAQRVMQTVLARVDRLGKMQEGQ